MSDETRAALAEAINAHVADECDGDLVGGWVLITETTNLAEFDDEQSSFYILTRVNQSNFMTTGLLYRALEMGRFDD